MPAVAAATERVNLYTNVLKTPLREPLLVAKSLGSIAAMFPGRIGLGVGLSWIPEEFQWLGQEMKTRGKRLDEQIEIIRLVIGGGYVEYHGKHYDFDRLRMEPPAPPGHPVPIYVGGHSEAGLRRAARMGDGWIGAQVTGGDAAAGSSTGCAPSSTPPAAPASRSRSRPRPIVPATVDDMAAARRDRPHRRDHRALVLLRRRPERSAAPARLASPGSPRHVIHPLRDLEIAP